MRPPLGFVGTYEKSVWKTGGDYGGGRRHRPRRGAVAHFAREVCERRRAPDILVNSAGVYISGTILDLTPDDWTWALSVNLFGVIHACHYFLPPMIARGGGGNIVNLVSMYGYWPSPGVAGYLTSKFGVFGFSEALREDLRAHNISVSTVCPGMINTGIVRNMRIRNAPGREDAGPSPEP